MSGLTFALAAVSALSVLLLVWEKSISGSALIYAVQAACGVRPELPAWLEGLMTRPEHIEVMANDQVEVERFVRSVSRAAKQGVAG